MNSSSFYPRLAFTGMRSNKSIYLPYLMAGSLIVMLLYALLSVSFMMTESNAKGAWQMGLILNLSASVCALLSIAILFYINSFIMKRRKKEFGLYSILGMEKRHIAMVVLWETIFVAFICIGGGIVFGALFSHLLFLVLLRIVGLPALLVFRIPLQAVLITAGVFVGAFAILLVCSVASVWRTAPAELLRSTRAGEREPRANWLVALLGMLTLGGGYMAACAVQTGTDALTMFLPAVLLVIVGTYCLFIAGSIVLLKLLRLCKSFYYKPRNFVAVSGMIYRMKQNATGLASICILASCLLVTLSSTLCLYLGEEEMLYKQYPRQYNLSSLIRPGAQDGQQLVRATAAHAAQYSVAITNEQAYYSLGFPSHRSGNGFAEVASYGSTAMYDDVTYETDLLLLEDYNRMNGTSLVLAPNEVLVASTDGVMDGWETVALEGKIYAIRAHIAVPQDIERIDANRGVVLVVPSLEALLDIYRTINAKPNRSYERTVIFSYMYDAVGEAPPEYYPTMRPTLRETVENLVAVTSRDSARDGFFQLYGSLMFVGVFFVALFLTAAVLTIYYKQITEGFDDHERFRIMQNVGMSNREVRSTISRQVLIVFFLPLAMAVLHVAVAFPVLCKLLRVFSMTNITLFLGCTVGAILAFALFYLVVYQMTSRVYYRIVQGK